tara:strand:- start:4660 stop:4920 length:261 start_codon:yes stop_codon:yes gene_type:complete
MENEKHECCNECGENCDCKDCDCCDKPKAGVLDQVQEKVVSRKLLVFIAATSLMIWSTLDPDTWAMIAAMYIGGQSVIDIAKVWKG